jgi:hypothetical protein
MVSANNILLFLKKYQVNFGDLDIDEKLIVVKTDKINSPIHDSVPVCCPLLYTVKKHHNKRVQGIKLHICQGSTMHKLQPSSYPKYAEGKTKSNREQEDVFCDG